MNTKFKTEVNENSEQAIKFLEDKIYEFNSLVTNSSDGKFFSRMIKNENGEIVAGVAGWCWNKACEITHLWVDAVARKNGLGKILLSAAEEEAKTNGCVTILIKSYSFQAPHFYEKFGYQTEYIQHDFPEGHNYYILTKKIST